MINDKIRFDTYKITASVKSKTVLDVGIGTGFLSVIAWKATSNHAYTVEFQRWQIMLSNVSMETDAKIILL